MPGFYAVYVLDFSKRLAPLHAHKRREVKFIWAQEHKSAFESLKQAFIDALVLQVPDFERSLF